MWRFMVVILIIGKIGSVESTVSLEETTTDISHTINKRSAPTTLCDKSRERNIIYSQQQTDTVWICKSGKWTPFNLTPSLGNTQDFPASSCKEIIRASCYQPPTDGMYWITIQDQCTNQTQTMKVWCDMSTCGGGWTLVWKHSYMEVTPLTSDMYYFSNHYRPCTDINSGWCNVPQKSRLNATEMMIVAYHNKRVVYAYRGRFNPNIDSDWTGGILLDHHKCVDYCAGNSGIRPAPSDHDNRDDRLLGIAFDKHSPDKYYHDCDTFWHNFNNPEGCRWGDCRLPTSISAKSTETQMTLAIYVR